MNASLISAQFRSLFSSYLSTQIPQVSFLGLVNETEMANQWHFTIRLVTFAKYKCRGNRPEPGCRSVAVIRLFSFSAVVSSLDRQKKAKNPLRRATVGSKLTTNVVWGFLSSHQPLHNSLFFSNSWCIQNKTILLSVPFIKTHFTKTSVSQIGFFHLLNLTHLDKNQLMRNQKRESDANNKSNKCYRVVKVSGTVHCVAINTQYKYFTCTWAQTRSTIQRQSTKGTRQISWSETQEKPPSFLRFS